MTGDTHILRLSKSARYALRALVYLAARQGEGRVLVERAAKDLELPPSYLAKVFQRLANRGLLKSYRGPHGGYTLLRPAAEITLADVVAATQEPAAGRRECLLEPGGCPGDGFCSIHDDVAAAEHRINDALSRVTLAQAVRTNKAEAYAA